MKYNEFGDKYQSINLLENWKVEYNTFIDVEPPFNDPKSDDWWYFKETLLQIVYKKNNLEILLDLGWYPEFDFDGYFCITVLRGDWKGNELLKFKSRSKQETVDKINEIFKDVAAGKIR